MAKVCSEDGYDCKVQKSFLVQLHVPGKFRQCSLFCLICPQTLHRPCNLLSHKIWQDGQIHQWNYIHPLEHTFCENIRITPFFQQTDLWFCLTCVTKSPLLIFRDLAKYLMALHVSHSEIFHMHWYYVGIGHKRKHVKWNNYPQGNIISFFSSNSSPISISSSGSSGLEYVSCTWDSFSKGHNYLKHSKFTDNPQLISKLPKRSVTGQTTLTKPCQ